MAKWLAKANDDILSFCTCTSPLASGPGQLDCPWCGCGWLISCIDCRKPFVFAQVAEIDRTYQDIVRMDFKSRGYEPDPETIENCALWMAEAVAELQLGEIVVYLDGCYFPVHQQAIEFEGDYAFHQFDRLPHAMALETTDALRNMLGEKSYWFDRERPDRQDDEE